MPNLIIFLLVVLSVVPYSSNYATQQEMAVNQFSMAREYGTLAFIAHNYEAGQYFGALEEGDKIGLVYGEHVKWYEVDSITRLLALSPYSPYSSFKYEDGGSEIFIVDEIFYRFYRSHDDRLVLQTCYDGSNGRLFVVAYPVDNP